MTSESQLGWNPNRPAGVRVIDKKTASPLTRLLFRGMKLTNKAPVKSSNARTTPRGRRNLHKIEADNTVKITHRKFF